MPVSSIPIGAMAATTIEGKVLVIAGGIGQNQDFDLSHQLFARKRRVT